MSEEWEVCLYATIPISQGLRAHELHIRQAGLKSLGFLTGPLYSTDMWFGQDQRANIIKTRVKKTVDYIFKYQKPLYIS
jgi:hypothetical protein